MAACARIPTGWEEFESYPCHSTPVPTPQRAAVAWARRLRPPFKLPRTSPMWCAGRMGRHTSLMHNFMHDNLDSPPPCLLQYRTHHPSHVYLPSTQGPEASTRPTCTSSSATLLLLTPLPQPAALPLQKGISRAWWCTRMPARFVRHARPTSHTTPPPWACPNKHSPDRMVRMGHPDAGPARPHARPTPHATRAPRAYHKHKPDLVVYVDRLDATSPGGVGPAGPGGVSAGGGAELPALRGVSAALGPQCWLNTIVALTHMGGWRTSCGLFDACLGLTHMYSTKSMVFNVNSV